MYVPKHLQSTKTQAIGIKKEIKRRRVTSVDVVFFRAEQLLVAAAHFSLSNRRSLSPLFQPISAQHPAATWLRSSLRPAQPHSK